MFSQRNKFNSLWKSKTHQGLASMSQKVHIFCLNIDKLSDCCAKSLLAHTTNNLNKIYKQLRKADQKAGQFLIMTFLSLIKNIQLTKPVLTRQITIPYNVLCQKII